VRDGRQLTLDTLAEKVVGIEQRPVDAILPRNDPTAKTQGPAGET
jgi:hypothetical protein